MKIEEYELGQKVSLYGVIEEINIEDIYDKENTTTLSIKTVTGKIHVNPKWEEVRLNQPKKEVPQMIFDVIESFNEDEDYLHEHVSCQSDEVREWLDDNERDFYEAWLAYPNITVKKEKLYTVEIPNPNGNLFQRVALCRGVLDNEVFINYTNDPSWKSRDKFQLTEQEIRKDFDWAWEQGFAKEVTE